MASAADDHYVPGYPHDHPHADASSSLTAHKESSAYKHARHTLSEPATQPPQHSEPVQEAPAVPKPPAVQKKKVHAHPAPKAAAVAPPGNAAPREAAPAHKDISNKAPVQAGKAAKKVESAQKAEGTQAADWGGHHHHGWGGGYGGYGGYG